VGQHQSDVRQNRLRIEARVPERHIGNNDVRAFGQVFSFRRRIVLFIGLRTDLFNPLEADARVLRRRRKLHQLFHRPVELPQDELNRQHHAQRHGAVDHGPRRNVSDDDAERLLQQKTARLLILRQRQAFPAESKQVGLDVHPAFDDFSLAGVEPDFLHAQNKLDDGAVVFPLLTKAGKIDFPPFAQKQPDPHEVEKGSRQEDQKNPWAVNHQHRPEHRQIENREPEAEHGAGHERFHTLMIIDPL